MSALVKFNDRNHVETTVLPTYHFQDALPSLVSFSISYYEFSLLILEILESRIRIPTVKLKIPAKSRIQKFCYIQVIVFDLSYLSVAAVSIFHIFSWLRTC